MDTQLEQIRDQQKETWNKFSPGWRKWDELTMEFLKPMGDEIIRRINPKDGDVILDVAAGTGEPGLTIASMMKSGKVIVTDLAEGMLEVARENASRRGIKNMETKACDVSELPFPDSSFDAVSCRFPGEERRFSRYSRWRPGSGSPELPPRCVSGSAPRPAG